MPVLPIESSPVARGSLTEGSSFSLCINMARTGAAKKIQGVGNRKVCERWKDEQPSGRGAQVGRGRSSKSMWVSGGVSGWCEWVKSG